MVTQFLLTRPSRDVTIFCSNTVIHGYISTHTPLAGRDADKIRPRCLSYKFLLTRPSRDVTTGSRAVFFIPKISTHTPLAGRDTQVPSSPEDDYISTHTPLAGRDLLGIW